MTSLWDRLRVVVNDGLVIAGGWVGYWESLRVCGATWLPVLAQTDGYTPLHAASRDGHVEVVRALLGGGAAVNQGMVRCHVSNRLARVTSHWAVEGVERSRWVWCVCSMCCRD